jgi:hypothetical protein
MIFGVTASVGGKYLILDEKTSNDSISLAIGGNANVNLSHAYFPASLLFSNLDLKLIGGKSFGKYTEDSLPGNIYLGLGSRIIPISLLRDAQLKPTVGILLGGEIPLNIFNTKVALAPELDLLILPFYPPLYPDRTVTFRFIPNVGIGFTFRP